MYMELITGSIGSGKSSYLYNTIKNNLAKSPSQNAILIVPEQFSYTAEKSLLKEFDGLGLNRVEVITFSRLCNRYLKQDNAILPSGKMMLAKKASSDLDEDNVYFFSSKHSGFTQSLSELFSELKRYNISPSDFENLNIENPHTSKKLSSVNAIYKAYLESFGEQFFDSDDALLSFCEFVSDSGIFKNTVFYIDDYNDFMPQHYTAIKTFLKNSLGVYVTLGIDYKNSNLFAPTQKTFSRLLCLGEDMGINAKNTSLKGSADYIKAEDIRFLLENWDIKPKYDKPSQNISVFNAMDLYSEVEHIAAQIMTLVREHGYRFRDIGIICGDMEEYLYILSSVFSDFDIPFFADEKLSVSMHPIAKVILSLFDIIKNNFSYDSVFAYLRLGYIYEKTDDKITAISQEDIDILENYVLLHGIKGKKMWFSDWTQNGKTVFDDVISTYSHDEFDLVRLNEIRKKVILPFDNFLQSRGRTAEKIAEAVYNFICDINLYDGLLSECEHFDKLGLRDESEQFKQVWNYIIETLDQIVSVLGGGAVSREAFAEYFECGLSGTQISIIPSGIDRVSLGTVSRNSPARVKVLFILGASKGQIPKVTKESTLLSDFDRITINSALSAKKKELAPDNINRILLENLKLYRVISTATEKLYISCPASDSEGNPIVFSSFVTEIIDMFDINVTDNIISEPTPKELIASAKHGFYYMLQKLSNYYKKTPEKLWQSVYDWYAKNDAYKDKLGIIQNAAMYKKIQPKLSKVHAEMLYGKNKKYSITALELYENCPFSYYLKNGMHVTAQKEKEIEKSHIGSLVHAAICEFCKIVEDGSTSVSEIHQKWCDLTEERCIELVHTVMENISKKVLSKATYEINQLEYLLSRCEFTLKKSIETIRKSLSQGKYTAVCYEQDFEVQIDWNKSAITLKGTIDRIDIMEDTENGKLNIRIIDYKTGNKSFSMDAICNKVDMQLVLYAIATLKMAESGLINGNKSLYPQISAILFNKIQDPELKEIGISEISSQNEKASAQKMSGLMILEAEENAQGTAFNIESVNDMDSTFSNSMSSDFLPIKINKNGTLSAHSSAVSQKEFEIISNYIKKSVIDADKAIESGNIDIMPYKNGENTPCKYCDFKEICMFDSHFDSYRIKKKTDNIIDFMEKEVTKDEQN